jgi:hypothetical protein
MRAGVCRLPLVGDQDSKASDRSRLLLTWLRSAGTQMVAAIRSGAIPTRPETGAMEKYDFKTITFNPAGTISETSYICLALMRKCGLYPEVEHRAARLRSENPIDSDASLGTCSSDMHCKTR